MRAKHKKEFHELCEQLTGLQTDYKAEDGVNRKRLQETNEQGKILLVNESFLYKTGCICSKQLFENIVANEEADFCNEHTTNLQQTTLKAFIQNQGTSL